MEELVHIEKDKYDRIVTNGVILCAYQRTVARLYKIHVIDMRNGRQFDIWVN